MGSKPIGFDHACSYSQQHLPQDLVTYVSLCMNTKFNNYHAKLNPTVLFSAYNCLFRKRMVNLNQVSLKNKPTVS